MKRFASITTVLFFANLLAFAPVRAAEETPPRSISTSGVSAVYVVPDEAVVALGINTFDQKLDEAKTANAKAATSLLKAIGELKIDPKNIQTDAVTVEIRYSNREIVEGYFVRRAYAVTLKDVALLEKLIDVALNNGANKLDGFQYRTSELRKHRDAARKLAIAAAREKAAALASELGCKIGPPRTIGESASYFDRFGGYLNNKTNFQVSVQGPADEAEGGDTMPLGRIAVQATVSVTFDLIPE